MSIRLVFGTVGLATFVLHNYYTSDLTSFMTAPNNQPLIKSIYELSDRPDIRLVLDKNLFLESLFTVWFVNVKKKYGELF